MYVSLYIYRERREREKLMPPVRTWTTPPHVTTESEGSASKWRSNNEQELR